MTEPITNAGDVRSVIRFSGIDQTVTLLRFPFSANASEFYVATCSCGQYRSGKFTYPGHAERAASAHVHAKHRGDRP